GSVHELAPLALARRAPIGRPTAPIGCRPLEGLLLRHVKTRPERAALLETTLGLPQNCRAAMIGQIDALWIGPGEWLLLAASAQGEPLADLERHLAENGAAMSAAEARLLVIELDTEIDTLEGLSGLPASALRPGA